MKDEPWIIPNYGCASINNRGGRCEGDYSNTIDKQKFCKQCIKFSEKKEGVR